MRQWGASESADDERAGTGQMRLLGPADPPPFTVVNPLGRAPVLVVCDHASRRIPAALDGLGLDGRALERHIASDIGAGAVAERLAALLDAPAVLAGYSRLVVDCNRGLDDPTAFLAVSDGEFVPGNRGLTSEAKAARARQFFHPYHEAIERRLQGFYRRGIVPAFVAVHSFTPVFREFRRPWQIGILWDKDPRIPVPLLAALRARGVVTGDNEPYSGRAPADYTVDTHAEAAGLPCVSLEFRQDLVENDAGADHWAALMAGALADILSAPALYRRRAEAEAR
jgi:predicted N-formylglutamate amidohydrolase